MDVRMLELELVGQRRRSLRQLARRARCGGSSMLVFGGSALATLFCAALLVADMPGALSGGGLVLASIVLMQLVVLWVSSRLHRSASRSLRLAEAHPEDARRMRAGLAELRAAFRVECVATVATLMVGLVVAGYVLTSGV